MNHPLFVPDVFNNAERSAAEALKLSRELWVQLRDLAQSVAEVRESLRLRKDFTNADALRAAVEKAGFYIEDKKLDGAPLRPKAYRKY